MTPKSNTQPHQKTKTTNVLIPTLTVRQVKAITFSMLCRLNDKDLETWLTKRAEARAQKGGA